MEPVCFVLYAAYSTAPQVYPWNVTGDNSSSTSIYLQWSAIPAELVAGVLREYRIAYDELNDRNESVKRHLLRLPVDQLSVNLTDLEKYTNYSFELQGISKFFGVSSPPIVIITDQDGKADMHTTAEDSNYIPLVFIPCHRKVRIQNPSYFQRYYTQPSYRTPCVCRIVLASVFCMAWYQIVMQHFRTVNHGISQLSLGIDTGLKSRV